MKPILIIAATAMFSSALFAQDLDSSRSIKRKAVECTGQVIKWMYRKTKSKNKNLTVFSKSFDQEFLGKQKVAGNKNFGLRGNNRVNAQKRFMVDVTNLLLDKQKPFMRDCIRLHFLAEKNCTLNPISGELNPVCENKYINNLNLAAIREKNRQ